MQSLHFDCECEECAVALSDLLRREMEDVVRLTSATITGLGRMLARDPCLHCDLVRGRRVNPRTAQRYIDDLRDFMLYCTIEEDSARSAAEGGEDLIST